MDNLKLVAATPTAVTLSNGLTLTREQVVDLLHAMDERAFGLEPDPDFNFLAGFTLNQGVKLESPPA